MTDTGQRLIEAVANRGIRETHVETRVAKEMLPDDIRDFIDAMRDEIPKIYTRLSALEGCATNEQLEGVYKNMKNLTELIRDLGEVKKQTSVQGQDLDVRIHHLENEQKSLYAAFRKVVVAVSDVGAMIRPIDNDAKKTKAA